MKVILKGGSPEKNEEIRRFFMAVIFPILNFGIAIEPSNAVIFVSEKQKDGTVKEYIDPTAEIIVELTEKALLMAMNPVVGGNELKKHSGNFHDEALAINFLQNLHLNFSLEYYSCRYKAQTAEAQEPECDVHGSIEHMQSNGKCPGCGKP